jgi:hypothetical protein
MFNDVVFPESLSKIAIRTRREGKRPLAEKQTDSSIVVCVEKT